MAVAAGPGRASAHELRTRLVAVRHGTTAWSIERRHTGRSDIPLEPEGEIQAVAVGVRLAGHDFALVLTSPLERSESHLRAGGVRELGSTL